jgi:hypothetical protein
LRPIHGPMIFIVVFTCLSLGHFWRHSPSLPWLLLQSFCGIRAAVFLTFLCQWCWRRLKTNCTRSVYSFLKWAASFNRVSGDLSSAAGGCCHTKAEVELRPQSAAVALPPHCVSMSRPVSHLELQLCVSAAPTAGFLWQPTEYNTSHHKTLCQSASSGQKIFAPTAAGLETILMAGSQTTHDKCFVETLRSPLHSLRVTTLAAIHAPTVHAFVAQRPSNSRGMVFRQESLTAPTKTLRLWIVAVGQPPPARGHTLRCRRHPAPGPH